jgi:hypothetical protein
VSDGDKDKDLKSAAADLVKKAITVGVGAVFLTEESLRGLVSEIKLPKELLGGILESAQKTKNEFLGKLSSDVLDRIMTRVDPKALVEEILVRNDLELQVKLSFRPKARPEAAVNGKTGEQAAASTEARPTPRRDDDPAPV